jgi:adenine-specific DNA-methyltransferase
MCQPPLTEIPSLDLQQGDCRSLLKRLPTNSVDLVVTSPPYFIGKDYDESKSLNDFRTLHATILPIIANIVKDGGSICWQVGYHVHQQSITPLDFVIHEIMSKIDGMKLRNRIVWHFGHGLHAKRRFSTRHEVILWYTKGDDYTFDLDAVRVPQKYPGKRFYKGPHKGELSGNPAGKNPEDVWDIPNIKAGHVEKTDHPCQFPTALVTRLVKALTVEGATVLDPFMGSGSTGVASLLEERNFIGIELDADYFQIARARCQRVLTGEERVRDDGPVLLPDPRSRVATRPEHFVEPAE